MFIRTVCPKCEFAHEVSDNRLGDSIGCQRCGEPFVIVENKLEEDMTFEMESIFRSEDGLADPTPTANPLPVRRRGRFNEDKHSLVVPPPPPEFWSGNAGADDAIKPFRTFDPDSRAVEKFLDRDKGTDYSWLLLLGVVVMVLSLCVFQVVLLGLIIFIR
jgi:hypothetical protein